MRLQRSFLALALPTALLVTGCSSGNDVNPSPTQETAATSAQASGQTPVAPVVGAYSIEALARALPAVADRDKFVLATGSFERAAAQTGLEPPSAQASITDLQNYYFSLTTPTERPDGSPTLTVLTPNMMQQNLIRNLDPEFADEVGWTVPQLDSFLSDTTKPDSFDLLVGQFDEAAIDKALGQRQDGVWAEPGEDFQASLKDASGADPLGRPIRMATDGSAYGYGFSTPKMTAWASKTGATMADDVGVVGVAQKLDAAEVYSAYILRGQRAETRTRPALTGQATAGLTGQATTGGSDQSEGPAFFDTVGAGLTVVGGEVRGVIVYHHPDAATATANIEAMRTVMEGRSLVSGHPLSELLKLVDVTAAGETSVATFTFPAESGPGRLWSLVQQGDILFASS